MNSDKSKMKMDILVRCILLLVWSLYIKGSHGKGYCRFPEFLWTPLADGSYRKWLTETEYVRNTDIWERQKEVTAKETEMVIKHKVQASCKNKQEEKNVPCHRRDLLYRIVCLSEEQGHKYRVQMHTGDSWQFTCMKFKKINKNIVQIFQAEPKEINEDRLCYDEFIVRQLWPWIAPVQYEWSLCPLTGGFDFGAFVNDKRQVCTRIWRPSRIESECIYGEGLTFWFPDSNCNPFGLNNHLEVRMLCWGDWVEGDYRFVVIGEIDKQPQFVLRVPEDLPTQEEFPAQFYFSPLTPMSLDGSVKVKVRRLLLRMKRSEPGVCYDESEECRRSAQEGKCTNTALHKYANFCKRSCGLCEFVPSIRAECRFPSSFQGEWELFETDRKETVKITTGEMTFERLGQFICKTKHWATDDFKLLSVFKNGCRPRYSCVHLKSEGSKILLFRISRSRLSDESFDMCQFEDDPLPIGNKVRSAEMKILLAKPSIQWGHCGLSGEVRVNASFPDGTSCRGKLTDWNKHTCNYRTKLSLEMEYCSHAHKKEFVCMAHMSVDDGFSILISKDETGDRQFSCWTVSTYPESMAYKPWKLATKLTRAQCGTQSDMQAQANPSSLIIKTYNDRVLQPCHKGNGRVVLPDERTAGPPPATPFTGSSTPGPPPHGRTTRTPEHRSSKVHTDDPDDPDDTERITYFGRKSNGSASASCAGFYRWLCWSLLTVHVIRTLAAPC